MDPIEITAILGACAPERRAFAEQHSHRTGGALLPAARLSGSAEPLLEVIALAPWCGPAAALTVELPADVRATDAIGLFDADSERLRLSHLICVVDAAHLLTDVMRDDYIAQRGGSLFVARAELLVTQMEYAS